MLDALKDLAEQQHALFTRRQALGLGLTAADLSVLVRGGRLERPARNVFRFPGSVPTWRQALLVAVFEAGTGAVASGRAAAALSGVPGFRNAPLDVLQPRGPSRRAPGRFHQTTLLPPHHVTIRDGIPVLAPARMLFDLGGLVRIERAERAVDNALAMDLVTIPRLEVVLAECARKGRPGSAALRAILDVRGDGYIPPESELEAMVFAVLTCAGLPLPVRQRSVGGTTAPVGRVDYLYPPPKFVIEADSKRHHSSWLDVVADRQRDARLMAAGYQILRVTWHQLVHEPAPFLDAVAAVLARSAAA